MVEPTSRVQVKCQYRDGARSLTGRNLGTIPKSTCSRSVHFRWLRQPDNELPLRHFQANSNWPKFCPRKLDSIDIIAPCDAITQLGPGACMHTCAEPQKLSAGLQWRSEQGRSPGACMHSCTGGQGTASQKRPEPPGARRCSGTQNSRRPGTCMASTQSSKSPGACRSTHAEREQIVSQSKVVS